MDAQDSLFDENLTALVETSVARSARPQCGVCGNPATWQPKNRRWSKYCGSNTCVSPTRPCKHCGNQFTPNVGQGGTKYCSLDCKRQGYTEGSHRRRERQQCAWCDEWSETPHWPGKWPYICKRCLEPIGHVVARLKLHSVSHERARKLVVDSGCEICGRNMLEWARPVQQGNKSMQPVLTVDHDHSCCPGQRSCGRCVRGLICMSCNAALGMLNDDLAAAQALAEYLRVRSVG